MTIFGASSLHPKFPFPAAVVELKVDRSTPGIPTFEPPYFGTLGRRCSYSGLSPSASNCLLHSVGGSRSRSMPMPPFAPRWADFTFRDAVRDKNLPRFPVRRLLPRY